MGNRRIYLDHNATTYLLPEVIEAMTPYFAEKFGNASSAHSFGREARKGIDQATEAVAEMINADFSEIVFTSGGTEADNLAIIGTAYAHQDKGKHIITSRIEHPAVLETCQFLMKNGFEVTFIPVDGTGLVDVDELMRNIRNDTILISIMLANNEVGTIEPIAEIGEVAKEHGVIFHTDAVNAAGKIKIDVQKLKVDLLSISAHKIYGPKGVGALYIRKGTKIHPIILGGHHQKGLRAGTENVVGIVGLGAAVKVVMREFDREIPRIEKLRNSFQLALFEKLDDIFLNGNSNLRLPNTLNLSFKYVEGENLLMNLDREGIAASTGSACASGATEPSHVLVAMGIPRELINGSMRFSLGLRNTKEEIDYTVEKMVEIVNHIRSFSPFYKKNKDKR